MIKYSVILLLYNSDLDKVFLTLKSICNQTLFHNEMEIIVADDGSKTSLYKEIEQWFKKRNFLFYKFTDPKTNVGTVRNILDGLSICEGKYVKLIGAGDLLFDQNVLCNVYQYMEKSKCSMCFGLMQGYCFNEQGRLEKVDFRAPKDIVAYKQCDKNWKRIERNVLVYGDWISGASMFFERTLLEKYLNRAKETVVYCEDLITANLILDRVKIGFINQNLIWYEVGAGISTNLQNGINPFLEKISRDHQKYYDYLMGKYPDNSNLKKGLRLMQYKDRNKLKNRIMKNLTEPQRLMYIYRIKWQKFRKVHIHNAEGFLDLMD